MRSFSIPSTFDPVPASVVRLLADVDRGQGREELYRNQSPRRLTELSTVSRVASAMTSSAIEGIVVPKRRAHAVLTDRQPAETDNEFELAGYQLALDDVYDAPIERLTVPDLLRWHRLLKQRVEPDSAGRLKSHENAVYDVRPDGSRSRRFQTVSVEGTPHHLAELCERYEMSRRADIHHPLVLVAAVTLDLLTIHPFDDSNGRVSRILTNALAVHSGYQVVRYQSIEELVAQHRDEYLDSLAASTTDWHESRHTIWPWASFLAARFADAYRSLDQRLNTPSLAESRDAVRLRIGAYVGEFTISDLRKDVPFATDNLLREELRTAVERGQIEMIGAGRGSRYLHRAVPPG